MKILVTGGCGYIGTELIKTLIKNFKIISVDKKFGDYLPKHKNLKNLKMCISQITENTLRELIRLYT